MSQCIIFITSLETYYVCRLIELKAASLPCFVFCDTIIVSGNPQNVGFYSETIALAL